MPASSVSSREESILAATAEAFAVRGYDATSMQDIADAVGLKKATLYHYFPSKDALSLRLTQRTLQQLIADVLPRAATGSARERVLAFVTAHARFFEQHHAAFVAMVLLVGSERHPDTLLERDRYERFLRDIVREGMDRGEFRAVDATLATRALLSTLNWMIRWFKPGGPLRAEDVAAQYADLILHGLAAAPEERR